jgi:hypothetical protein
MALSKYAEQYVREFFASGEPGKVSKAKRYLESQGLKAEDYGYVDPEVKAREDAARQKRTIEAEREPVVWKDYDLDGDGYLSPSEYSAYTDAGGITTNAVPRITQAELDAIETETSEANESVSKSPYEDGSASDSFYGNWGFPVPDTEKETEAALIAAAETGNIDVIEAILSTASNAVSGAVLNTVMETFFDSLDIPAGLDDLSGYGSTPRPEFKVDLEPLAAIYLAAGSGNETPLTLMDARGLALLEHMRAVKENIQQTNAYVDAYGGSFYDYFVMPNLLVELSPLAQEV